MLIKDDFFSLLSEIEQGQLMDKDDNIIDHKCFISLLVPNQTKILAFILSLVPNISDAEDIYQETVSTMWDKISAFEKGTDFVAWGVTIAKYKVLEFRTKHKRSKMVFTEKILEQLEPSAKSKISDIKDHLDALKTCVKKLSKNEKNLLKMRYEQDLSFQKMALRVGKTSPAVFRIMAIIHSRLALCIRGVMRGEVIT
jgi:RNA polymerase sigma-70 factor (ECF subfamily)